MKIVQMRQKTAKTACRVLLFVGFCSMFLGNGTRVSAQNSDSVHVTLDKAVQMALSDAPSVRIADRNVQIKKYYNKEQIAALFPDVSMSASYQRTLKKQKMAMQMNGQVMEIEVGMANNYMAGASLSLPLVMPTLWANVKLSQMDIDLALEQARSSKIALVNQVKQAYYTLLLARESYRVLQQNYAHAELSNQRVANQYNLGLVSEFEKLRSDVSLQNQRPAVTSAEKALKLSVMRLKVILGMNLDEPIIFDGQLSDFEQEVLNASLHYDSLNLDNNSSLKQMDFSIMELQQSKKLIKYSACPTLSLSGNYQYMALNNDFKFSNYNWFPYSVMGLSLRVPIISWVGTSYKLKESDLNIANMQDQRTDLERNLRISMQSNINDMQQAMEDLASNKETMTQAQRAYDIAQKQYEVGTNTWLDLNTAELTLISSQLTYNQSLYNYLTAKSTLESVLGNE